MDEKGEIWWFLGHIKSFRIHFSLLVSNRSRVCGDPTLTLVSA